MPVIVPILIVLAIALLVVVKMTSNSKPMTEEQTATYAKWIRILVPVMLIAVVIRYFVG